LEGSVFEANAVILMNIFANILIGKNIGYFLQNKNNCNNNN
jgi:hypothetical protein